MALAFGGCLDLATTGFQDSGTSPPYPSFVAIQAGTSYALPTEFDPSASVRLIPQGVARIVSTGSTFALAGIQPGFAAWDPHLRGYHSLQVAVLGTPRGAPLLVAHHGVQAIAPENTLDAVRAGCDLGIPGIEVDVRFTADSVPVLLHDRDVRRTSNGTGYVDQMTLAELRRLDFGSWYSPRYAGATIPTLSEFLAVASACRLDLIQLDMKSFAPMSGDAGLLEIGAAVQEAGLSAQEVQVGAFQVSTLRRARTLMPGTQTLLYADSVSSAVADAVIGNGISAVGVQFAGYSASATALARLDAAGVQIGVWAPPSVLELNTLSPRPRVVTTDWGWVFPN